MSSSKPRPLGNRARQGVTEIDCTLAAAERQIQPVSNGDDMLWKEAQLRASRTLALIASARRMVAEVLSLGLVAREVHANGKGE